jgi:hypothetical protein
MDVGRQEKPLDPAAGPVAAFAVGLRKLRRDAGSPTYDTMARRTGAYSVATLSRAAGGEQLPTLPVLLAYVAACDGDLVDWELRWTQVAEELAIRAAEANDEQAPYRGLSRFEPADRDIFFGRDRLVRDLLALTTTHRVVTVFGPSGIGKSSLLRAGLVPRLQESETAPAAIRLLTPGERPLSRHRAAFVPADAPGDTWLIVDQFEELFTLCRDPEERDAFLTELLAADRRESRLRVVLGIRADFYPHCLNHTGIAEAVRKASLPVGPLTREELREVITGPARARSLVVERALTAVLVDEVHGRSPGLPVLSHVLLETWRRRSGRSLTLEGYERAGGISGAIAQSAEAAYERMDSAQAATARQVVLRLITPGDGTADTRRPASRAELESIGTGRDASAVLDTLARARLISLDADSVELAHEALITAWPRLRAWMDEDREKLRLHRWLTDAADGWEAVQRDPGVRISPVRLARLAIFFGTAGGRAELTALEADFLDVGLANHRRTIRTRRISQATMPLLGLLVLVAGSLAWQQSRSRHDRGVPAAAVRTTAAVAGAHGRMPGAPRRPA